MTESEFHKQGVRNIKAAIEEAGGHIFKNSDKRGEDGWEFPEVITDKGIKGWTADVCAELDGRRFIVENDGTHPEGGHLSTHSHYDREFRTWFLKHYYGIDTVEFKSDEVAGKKRMSNAEIMKQIRWTLAGKPKLSETPELKIA